MNGACLFRLGGSALIAGLLMAAGPATLLAQLSDNLVLAQNSPTEFMDPAERDAMARSEAEKAPPEPKMEKEPAEDEKAPSAEGKKTATEADKMPDDAEKKAGEGNAATGEIKVEGEKKIEAERKVETKVEDQPKTAWEKRQDKREKVTGEKAEQVKQDREAVDREPIERDKQDMTPAGRRKIR